MRKLRSVTAGVGLMAALSCAQEPAGPNGTSLLCESDSDCSGGPDIRCYQRLCVRNSAPVLEALDPLELAVGEMLSAVARATDAEGDPIIYLWMQTRGPRLLPTEGFTGRELTATPAIAGEYEFRVTATDAYTPLDGALAPRPVVLVVNAYCTADSHCASDKRCAERVCIINRLPNVEDFTAPLFTTPGVPTSTEAYASDAEGDPITYTWAQLAGAIPTSVEAQGATLTVAANALGKYVFSVQVTDDHADRPSIAGRSRATLIIVVQPEQPALYVSDVGLDSPGCGSFTAPCASIRAGVAALASHARIGEILLAAPTAGAYAECLDLGAGQRLVGCFSADTWARLPRAPDECRIECDRAEGHRLAADAVLAGVALAVRFDAPPVPSAPVVTVRVSGEPVLTDVDVETAACGPDCEVVGIASVDASPTFDGVEIHAALAGFDPVARFTGYRLVRGNPQILGAPMPRIRTTPGRGSVVMNAPVIETAFGVVGVNTHVRVQDVRIVGGLAPLMGGFDLHGGRAEVRGAVVELTGYGSRAMQGLVAHACDANVGCACDIRLDPACTPLAAPVPPELVIEESTFVLTAASDVAGMRPCSGIGVGIEASQAGARVVGSEVVIGPGFSRAIGLASYASKLESEGGYRLTPILGSNTFVHNHVQVDGAEIDGVCWLANQTGTSSDRTLGAYGLLAANDDRVVVEGNTIETGSNTYTSVGIEIVAGVGHRIEQNTVTVADLATGVIAPAAYGSLLAASSDPHAPSLFTRNRVRLGAEASATTALLLHGGTTWTVQNNFLFGGLAPRTAGLTLFALENEWPKLQHNSIYAGRGLTARTVVIDSPSAASGGTFVNNLLDAGDACGRRFILDNLSGALQTLAGNIAQWPGPVPAPAPRWVLGSLVDASNAMTAFVVLAASGEIVTVSIDNIGPPTVAEKRAVAIGGEPLAFWSGVVGTEQKLVATLADAVATASLATGRIGEFVRYPLVSSEVGEKVKRRPRAAALGNLDDAAPDLVFLEGESAPGAADGGVWILAGERTGGFGPAVRAPGYTALTNPSLLAMSLPGTDGRTDFLVAQGTRLHAHSTRESIDLGPAFGISSILAMEFANFGEKSDGGTTSTKPDLVVLGSDAADASGQTTKLLVFLDPSAAQLGSPVRFDREPCSSGNDGSSKKPTAASFHVVRGTPELWVGCQEGAIEIYGYIRPGFQRNASRIIEAGATAPLGMLVFPSGNDRVVAVTRTGVHALETYSAQLGFNTAPLATLTFAGNLAMRDGDTLRETFLGISNAQIKALLWATPPAPVCTLVLRTPPPADPPLAREHGFDLHLAETEQNAVCKDALTAAVSSVADDIDALYRRTSDAAAWDGKPDVGADEVP